MPMIRGSGVNLAQVSDIAAVAGRGAGLRAVEPLTSKIQTLEEDNLALSSNILAVESENVVLKREVQSLGQQFLSLLERLKNVGIDIVAELVKWLGTPVISEGAAGKPRVNGVVVISEGKAGAPRFTGNPTISA